MSLRQFTAFLDTEQIIRVQMNTNLPHQEMVFRLENEVTNLQLELLSTVKSKDTIIFQLKSPRKIDLTTFYTVLDQDRNYTELGFGDIVRSQIFDKTFAYKGTDLGAAYSPQSTTFRFWAPISKQVFVVINGTPYTMERKNHGCWTSEIRGDLEGKTYHYLHRVNGEWIEVHDPYAISSQSNSGHSYIINPNKLLNPVPLEKNIPISQAIIYEMSIRDFSQQKEAGFFHSGQFLGLKESPIISNQTIGFDYDKL